MAYEIRLNEPMPDHCSDCRFMYDYLYCVLDGDKHLTFDKEHGRPNHCKLIPIENQVDIDKVLEDVVLKIQQLNELAKKIQNNLKALAAN